MSSSNDALCSDAADTEYISDSEFSVDRGGHTKYYRIYVSLPKLYVHVCRWKLLWYWTLTISMWLLDVWVQLFDIKAFVELHAVWTIMRVVTKVNPYAIQLFHRVQCVGWKVRYKLQCLSEGGIYDCICIASCSYYPRAAIIKTVAINREITRGGWTHFTHS